MNVEERLFRVASFKMLHRFSNVYLFIIIYILYLEKVAEYEAIPQFNYDYTDDTKTSNNQDDDEVINSIQVLVMKLVGKLYNDLDQLDDQGKDDLKKAIAYILKYVKEMDYNEIKENILKYYDIYQKKIHSAWLQTKDLNMPFGYKHQKSA